MTRLILLIAVLLAVGLAGCGRSSQGTPEGHSGHGEAAEAAPAKEIYTCPMHPSVISDRPGACPVCGMALVRKSAETEVSGAELGNLRGVSLSPAQRIIANVATAHAERQSLGKLLRTVGTVGIAEPLQATVAARFRGRIEKLHVAYTGQVVHKGEALFDLYSPDLVSAEEEFLLTLSHSDPSAPTDGLTGGGTQLAQAARERLLTHFGFTEKQVTELERTRKVRSSATFFSPIRGTVLAREVQEGQYVDEGMPLYRLADLSRVWITLDVYEKDLPLIGIGQSVRVTTEAYPGDSFAGKVTFIDPVVDGLTRTVRVRTEFDNRGGKLKPQMYVRAEMSVPKRDVLVVPATAVLSLGRHDIVWVEVAENRFEPRMVVTGERSETSIEIVSGLEEGDTVVISGGYLLESESQLQNPGATSHSTH